MNALTDQSRPALGRGARLREDPLTGEALLLFPEGVLPLDTTTHDILLRCTGDLTLAHLLKELNEEYEAAPDELRADVVQCLTHLRQEMLVTW